ncbi:MAG TPA: hypothetical protein VFW14_04130 [Gaiellales bacterium]|nr:hypothetical protein [Gaiellales bacterium]
MGVFAKVLLAIAILVANGVLLFVILRFLLWLAFPGKRDDEAAVAAARPAAGGAAAATAAGGGKAATVAAQAPEPLTPAPTPGMPILAATSVGRSRAYPHRLLIGLPVILALFAGGVWLGSVVGGSGAAAAATRTIHVTGHVITIDKKAVVSVPSTTVVVKGSIVSVPATTVTLPPQAVTRVVKRTVTTVRRLPGKTTTVSTTIAIPTTVTATGTTVTTTVTSTETVTSDTSTTSTSATT